MTIWVGCAICGAVPRFAYGLEYHAVIRQSIQEDWGRDIAKSPRNHKGVLRGKVGVTSCLPLRSIEVLRLGIVIQ